MTEPAQAEDAPRGRNWRYSVTAFAVALLLLLAALALPYAYHRAGLYAKSADEAARTFEAWNLAQPGSSVYVGPWLPLHTMITAAVLRIWDDTFLAPRALSMALGVLLVAALGWLGAEVSRRRAAALLCMALGVCFGPRVVLAAIPLSETLYMLFVVLGMAAFARWLRLDALRWFITGALALGLAACVRYEGWLFAATATLFAAIWLHFDKSATKPRRLAALFIAMLFLWAGPLAWCITWYRAHGDPFGFLSFSEDRYFRVANPDHDFARLWEHSVIYQFWRQNLLSLNLIGVAGIVLHAIERRRAALWFLIPCVVFLALGALGLTGRALPTHNFWRIAAPFSVLLLAFTTHAILASAAALGKKWRPAEWVQLGTAGVVLLLAFHFQCFNLAEETQLDDDDLEAAAFIRQELEARGDAAQARVFIEDSDIRWHHVRILSGFPRSFLPAAPVDSVLKLQMLDLDKLRAEGVAVIVLHEEFSDKIPRVENTFSAADKNERWVMLAFARPKPKP